MSRFSTNFEGPFLDSYGIGFRLYQAGQINWKHRTIAGVSWNGQDQEAYFFNPDGLGLPIKANPWKLPEWIRSHAVRREFASVHGYGHFAMKDGRLKALQSVGMTDWVTYWLVDQSDGFSNDADVWHRYVEADLAIEKTNSETLHREMRLDTDPAAYQDQCLAERREVLATQHRRRSAEDQKILAWLKGETPPPLLASA